MKNVGFRWLLMELVMGRFVEGRMLLIMASTLALTGAGLGLKCTGPELAGRGLGRFEWGASIH